MASRSRSDIKADIDAAFGAAFDGVDVNDASAVATARERYVRDNAELIAEYHASADADPELAANLYRQLDDDLERLRQLHQQLDDGVSEH